MLPIGKHGWRRHFLEIINFEWNVKFTDANLMSAVFKDVVLGDTDFSSSIMDSINFINIKDKFINKILRSLCF
jgi:uncharacterized protein YjbI with pentapeptide repeats